MRGGGKLELQLGKKGKLSRAEEEEGRLLKQRAQEEDWEEGWFRYSQNTQVIVKEAKSTRERGRKRAVIEWAGS